MKSIEEEVKSIAYEICDSCDEIGVNQVKEGIERGVELAQKWIPVDEKPLPYNNQILVKTDNGSVYDVVKSPSPDRLIPWWSGDKITVIESYVTHWRPIEFE